MSRAKDSEPLAMTSDTLAFIFLKLGKYEKASQKINVTLEKYRELSMENPVVHYHCWQIYTKAGKSISAENHPRAACKLVGGPHRLASSLNLVGLAVGEDEVIEMIDSWLAGNIMLFRLGNLFESEFRLASSKSPPSSESQVSDVVETILRAAGMDPLR